jgi:hypothetical protein
MASGKEGRDNETGSGFSGTGDRGWRGKSYSLKKTLPDRGFV